MEMIFSDGSVYPQKGKFWALQRQVDSKTGTLQVAAVFPNPNHILRPGQFVRVRAHLFTRKDAMLVPQRAISELQSIYQVAVVGPDDKVEIRTVKVGERYGTQWIVTEGLSLGDRVVAEGIQKVKQGMQVNVSQFVPSTTAPAPAQAGAGG